MTCFAFAAMPSFAIVRPSRPRNDAIAAAPSVAPARPQNCRRERTSAMGVLHWIDMSVLGNGFVEVEERAGDDRPRGQLDGALVVGRRRAGAADGEQVAGGLRVGAELAAGRV